MLHVLLAVIQSAVEVQNIKKAIKASRKVSEYFHMTRQLEVCEFCECNPCDCSWGYNTKDKIVISNGGNCENNPKEDQETNSRSSN